MRSKIKKLHPKHLSDFLIEKLIAVLEAWAIIRVLLILLLVLLTILMGLKDINAT